MSIEADAFITDPPYGMEWEGNQRFSGGNTRRGKGTRHAQIIGDSEPFDPALAEASGKVMAEALAVTA